MIVKKKKEKRQQQKPIDDFYNSTDMFDDEELIDDEFYNYEDTLEDKELIDDKFDDYLDMFYDEELQKKKESEEKQERKEKQGKKEKEAHEKGEDIIYLHVETLRRKRMQKIIKDDYGNVFDEKWEQEKEYFFQNVMKKDQNRSFQYNITTSLIDKILDEYEEKSSSEYSANMSPYDYEHYCASLLNENGWEAQATQGSGDQGVDVVATKNGHRIAIQCKKYSSPVGNKAVQEVFSAKSHIGADHAIVVTNHSYTKSAKELASTTGVFLLHHDELKNLPF